MYADLPFNLTIVGLFLVQFFSVLVFLFGIKAVAQGKGDVVSSTPCQMLGLAAGLSWTSAVYMLMVNIRTRNASGQNKVVKAGWGLTLFSPLWLSLLVSDAILTSDINKYGCYGGPFCRLAKFTMGSGWLLFALMSLLMSLWIGVVRASNPVNITLEEGFDSEHLGQPSPPYYRDEATAPPGASIGKPLSHS